MYDRLSAKERAILALQRWKAGEGPDEALKRSTPQHDVKMVWKYLDAARDTGTIVGGQTAWLEAKLEALEARLVILALFRLWEMHAEWLRMDLHFEFPELLTESQHRARVEAQRARLLSIEEASALLVDDDEDAGDDQRLLRDAIRAGEPRAVRGNVRLGELMDWSGNDVPVPADRAFRVAILPDSVAEYVAAAEAARLKVMDRLDEMPGETPNRMSEIREDILRSVVSGLGQAEMTRLGLEEVVAWAAEDFDDEEPIHPGLRADLDAAAGRIRELAASLDVYGVEVELPTAGAPEMVLVLKRAIAN